MAKKIQLVTPKWYFSRKNDRAINLKFRTSNSQLTSLSHENYRLKIKILEGSIEKAFAQAIGSSETHERVQRNIRYIMFLIKFLAHVTRVLPKLYLRTRVTPKLRGHALGVCECVIAPEHENAIRHSA